jgi:copper chaperone CopZ
MKSAVLGCRFRVIVAAVITAVAAGGTGPLIYGQQEGETRATLLLTGLHCPPCTHVVQQALTGLKGVRAAEVDWNRKSARVWFDEKLLPLQKLTNAIHNTPHMMGGSQRYVAWVLLKTPAVAEPTEAEQVKKVLLGVTGVRQVAVYPAQRSVAVLLDDRGQTLTAADLRAALVQQAIAVLED